MLAREVGDFNALELDADRRQIGIGEHMAHQVEQLRRFGRRDFDDLQHQRVWVVDEVDVVVQAPHHQGFVRSNAVFVRERGKRGAVRAIGGFVLGVGAGVGQREHFDLRDRREQRPVLGAQHRGDRQLAVRDVASVQHDEIGAPIRLAAEQMRLDRRLRHRAGVGLHADLAVGQRDEVALGAVVQLGEGHCGGFAPERASNESIISLGRAVGA